MADPQVEARRTARVLSNSGFDDVFTATTSLLHDYGSRVIEYLDTANIDKRTKVIGPDLSYLIYHIAHTPTSAWSEMLWGYEVDLHIWEDLLRPIPINDQSLEPLKVLTHLVSPHETVLKGFTDGTRNITLVNTCETSHLEDFLFNHPDTQHLEALSYSVVDQQDVLAGTVDSTFDLVRIWSWLVLKPTTTLLSKYMDSVKIGGVLVINDSANMAAMLHNSDKVHYSPYYDIGKFVAMDNRFVTYHLPHNIGTIVAKRIS